MEFAIAFGLLAQMRATPDVGAGGAMAGMFVWTFIWLGVAVITWVAEWFVFEKAGRPGWAAIVPIYNLMVLCDIVDLPMWYGLVPLIPCVGIIAALYIHIVAGIRLAEKFDQGGGFAVGLILLPVVFYPILGFGSAQFEGRGRKKRKKKLKSRRRYEEEEDFEDEDDYDEPRSRRRPADDDEEDYEEEPPPRARRRRVAEDEEEEEHVAPAPRPAAPRPAPQPAAAAKVSCPHCGAVLKLPPGLQSGKRIKCPKCNGIFAVP